MSYEKINKILDDLDSLYPNAKVGLDFTTPFELLIATILSAQCTDVRVNKVTAVLFKEHNTPKAILGLGVDGLTKYIKSCGLYKTKYYRGINEITRSWKKNCKCSCEQCIWYTSYSCGYSRF